uniref:Uncharacterized protein n=1 Tax=Glossina austeni TaxID=7395 RepID=A0A1A9UU18_GLOAU
MPKIGSVEEYQGQRYLDLVIFLYYTATPTYLFLDSRWRTIMKYCVYNTYLGCDSPTTLSDPIKLAEGTNHVRHKHKEGRQEMEDFPILLRKKKVFQPVWLDKSLLLLPASANIKQNSYNNVRAIDSVPILVKNK